MTALQELLSTTCDVGMSQPAEAFEYPTPAPSPREDSRQMVARKRQQLSRRRDVKMHAYEGATSSRATWMTSQLSADSDLELDRESLTQRSRYLYRNESIGGAIDQRKDLVVGTGFTPQAQIREVKGRITAAQAEEWNSQLEEVFEEWAPLAGVSGKDSIWEMSRLIEGHHGFDGESVTILSDVRHPDKPIPLAVEVVDPMRLETPPGKEGDPHCRLGVQYDPVYSATILGYWIRNKHPGDTKDIDQNFTFYPANRVLHVFEKMFAGQSRGLTWLVRALLNIVDRKDLKEAGIITAQIQSCYVHYITKSADTGLDASGNARRNSTRTTTGGQLQRDIRPGTEKYLEEGETVTNATPPTGTSTVDSLNTANDRGIAAALNMAYEMLAKDWRGVSFAGGRIILSGVKLDTESRQERLATRWFRDIWNMMVDEAVMLLEWVTIPITEYNKRPLWYRRHQWVPQAWAFSITPGEEVDALLKKVDGNLMTKAQAVAQTTGGKWRHVSVERGTERQTERDLEIVPTQVAQGEAQAESIQQREQQNQKAGAL